MDKPAMNIDRGEYKYEAAVVKDAKGNKKRVVDNGDGVAKALRGMTQAQLGAVMKENGLQARYADYLKRKMNPGQIRMAVGQVLRFRIRAKKEKTTVNGKAIDGRAVKA